MKTKEAILNMYSSGNKNNIDLIIYLAENIDKIIKDKD